LSYRNPSPNYQQALEELESYISLDPDGGKTDEIQNWLTILRRLETASRQLESALRENRNMKRNIGDLNKENVNIKETVEKLKRLDLQLKKKRENIR
jgi:hypothetical protein